MSPSPCVTASHARQHEHCPTTKVCGTHAPRGCESHAVLDLDARLHRLGVEHNTRVACHTLRQLLVCSGGFLTLSFLRHAAHEAAAPRELPHRLLWCVLPGSAHETDNDACLRSLPRLEQRDGNHLTTC